MVPAIGLTLYVDANFGGASFSVGVGTFNHVDMAGWGGVSNDTISSLKVEPKFTVLACQHGDGSGICMTYTSTQPMLGALDNEISYLVITYSP